MQLVSKDLEENLMPRKKFTLEQRKKMLEHLESGATAADLKREFSIKDPRTLQRQLRQAREEQTLQVVRTDIIKESLREHLAEVRTLIENWSAGIKAPSPPSFARYPLSTAEEAEQVRLFEAIREHLPFPELWRSYQALKLKWNEYTTTCKDLHQQVVEKAKEKWGLSLLEKDEQRPGLTSSFSWHTLDYAIKAAMGEFQTEMLRYDAKSFNPQAQEIEYLLCNDQVILYAKDAGCYVEVHRSMVTELARSEKVVSLVKLLNELRHLERRIQGILEETLLRRDYILYNCRLCPGGAGLAFR
jgi:transposase-like protein